jgi:hypothetical protein
MSILQSNPSYLSSGTPTFPIRKVLYPLAQAGVLRALAAALQQPPMEFGLKITSERAPLIRYLMEFQDPVHATVLRITSAAFDLIEWEPSTKVTLIEDEIHVMSPAKGVSAATALRDAVRYITALEDHGLSTAGISFYESAIRSYAGASMQRSYGDGLKFFGQPPFERFKTINE